MVSARFSLDWKGHAVGSVNGRVFFLNLTANGLHPQIHGGNIVGTVSQFLGDEIGVLDILFVFDLMLQTGPEIHGNGAELHFYFHMTFAFGKENRNADDEMQAAVADYLGITDVIIGLQQRNIILFNEAGSHRIDIIGK